MKDSTRNHSPSTWSALAVLALAMACGGITARLEAGPKFEWLLLVTAMGLAAAVLMRLLADNAEAEESAGQVTGDPTKDLLDSAGSVVLSMDLDGRITYINPSGERLLGYRRVELVNTARAEDLLASGEAARLIAEMQTLARSEGVPSAPGGRMATFAESVRSLPPSQVPSFDTLMRRKDSTVISVRLNVSALRNKSGEPVGLVAMALDLSQVSRKEQAAKGESPERYRDVFENSSEMVATLDLRGRFLYVNPAWKRCFGLEQAAPGEREFFEESFSPDSRAEAAALLRRVLEGETIDRAPMRNETPDGHLQELELSLHQRRRGGKAVAVQCLIRDVTQQKQREHRLALQLLVSQIVGENVSSDTAAMRVLEALCVSQGWDVAVKWEVNTADQQLEFSTAWGVPGERVESLIRESMGMVLKAAGSVLGQAWKDGRLVWVADLTKIPVDPRLQIARRHKMVSGWAVPVQVGSSVLAVLEFYSHLKVREDRETIAALETVAASLGQMLARAKERERAEELSRQQKILLHSVADGICGVDRNGLVRFANPAASRLLGAPAGSIIGKEVHELLHGSAPPGEVCGEDCPLRAALEQRIAASGENNLYRPNGTSFPAEYFLNPILDAGRFSGSVLSFRDISQRYALDRMKDEFVSTVSHELRTPLTSIRGALGLLSSGMLGQISDKASNLLRIALSNSDRLVRLINDILDLEKAQSGREPLVFRPVQMGDLVRQSMDGVQVVAEEAGVLLINDKTQVEITADSDRLLQVLTNLLSNAVKFSPAHSAVSIMLRPGSSGVTLSVIDQGRGIPADKLEAIFGRFQQVDASDSRQKGGSGLGLAICRAIVQQHNGRIWAERNPLRGSTFRVFLPYHPAAAAPASNVSKVVSGPGVILLASANAASRPLLGQQLADHGYRIVETSTLEQTVVAAHEGVEAIVLDTNRNGMNGWEVLPHLRQNGPEAQTPVLLISLDTQEDSPQPASNGDARHAQEAELMGELVRVMAGPGERLRILVVENTEEVAYLLGEVFSWDSTSAKLARTRQEATEACRNFQPHLVVVDIDLPNSEASNFVDWIRDYEAMASVPMIVFSSKALSRYQRKEVPMDLSEFLMHARVQPEQLESLVLTRLREPAQVEEAVSEIPGVRSA
ncbi:MAG TPA: PAS domain S-box protein [Terracidiphilus sp.]|nr:PAS domain S-box protein [Terracidiphilus sp.]